MDGIDITHRDGVLRVGFNRPDRLNAVDTAMLVAAAAGIEDAATDEAVRAIVLTGEGRAFCAGSALSNMFPEPDHSILDAVNRLVGAIKEVPKPVLVGVNGVTAGIGCSFALAADLVLAKESAFFVLGFTDLGIVPDGGATYLLPAAIGRARATRMTFLSERVTATTAAEWGMISGVVADDAFDATLAEWASRLAAGPTVALAETKKAFAAAEGDMLRDALAREKAAQDVCMATDDFVEGTRAATEKRSPRFRGI
ncbi:enoyl-CoA hydratase-related protein [Aeromicrobium fastidiosum]|uniref:Enoyl-CoA hydratase n=1 Tax=Aeromicrobium fastidiosum TaxID=52699 RepID=A0A641APN7_9ACTN|nr:enoyl-CoA hydratase-related protein [Aeromicrobium fastidiosum]KAA1379899.1 enoyl-CoA hydratase [Aeromicrobium fastidiosum]MBP2389405.1 enoyl-CoA hydratase/carnithine racemase [Aeromicrobium fastidiosum]